MGKKIEPLPKRDQTEIMGILCIAFAVVLSLSLISFAYGYAKTNILGLVGYYIGITFHALFGIGSYLFCPFLFWLGFRWLFRKSINEPNLKCFYFCLLLTSTCMLLSLAEDQYPSIKSSITRTAYTRQWHQKMNYHIGGAPFFYLYRDLPTYNLYRLLNAPGVFIVFLTTFFASLFFLAKLSPASAFAYFRSRFPKRVLVEGEETTSLLRRVLLHMPSRNTDQEFIEIQPEVELKTRPSLSKKISHDPLKRPKQEIERPKEEPKAAPKKEAPPPPQLVYKGDFAKYKLPSPSLLTPPQKVDTSQLKKNLKRQAEVLEETLFSFGIEAKVGEINCGPTITSFEVHPAIGVKVQKIKALENDIALNMEAKSIRIIAPIPGKAAIGIEVPNATPQEVGFRDVLNAYEQQPRKFHVPILLGKAVNGDFVMTDLAKMPHCIIAGATGSGKSVCINTIVMSILMTARPDEIRLLMVDPKKVELSAYSKLPHMLAPVITEPQGACAALNWLVKEMENRYDILRQTGVRNIDAFNRRKINKEFEAALDREIPERMHYIVGIIDELADLMMISSSDIETPIARIAQMARAVGIHLILATQRPSREVITGLIKANFPTRISFKVASRINSQIILDEVGAESLLGNGDMLFLPPGTSHLVRAQGAFIRDEDINAVIDHICSQAPPNYVIKSFDDIDQLDQELLPTAENSGDNLYSQALDIVMKTGNASTTFLQRKLKIGYSRAASLMDMLEDEGVVSPGDGVKARKVKRDEDEYQDS